jgi:predicted negative regulator of RcsB-dependent stress response
VYGQTSSDSSKASPPGGMAQKSAYYLFYSDYENGDYADALHFGRWILINTPKKIKNYPAFDLATNLDRFVTIYNTYADSASNLDHKKAYIDTVNQVYKKAFKTLDKNKFNPYQWHLNWGRFYHKYSDFVDSAKAKTTAQYLAAYKLHPDSISAGDAYYLKVLLQNLVKKGTPQSKKQARAIIKKERKYADSDLNDYLDNVQKGLFENPKQRIAYLEKKVSNNPKDEKDLKTLRRLYRQQNNSEKVQQINQKLYKLDPSYDNATSLANAAISNDNYTKAITYLKKAGSKTDDSSKLKVINLNLARSYLHEGQLKTARNYARKSRHEDSKWARPYIIIADIYAHQVKKCTANRNLTKDDKAVYWLVVDNLNKAKRLATDSAVKSTINDQLQTYRQYTPTKDDIFFKGWKKGQTIKINSSLDPCYSWIDETTKVQ